jgi:peptidoglycan/LPS O-acetylase OafA/YrhL
MKLPQCLLHAAPDLIVAKSSTDALTGIRFFAAAAIVLNHSQNNYYFHQGAFDALSLARAVQLFFALSGFVLAINAGKYLSFWDFIVARFARIWPAHLFGLLLCTWLIFPGGLRYLSEPSQFGALALNLALLQAWVPHAQTYYSYNAPSWSISCEMFFYLVFLPVFWFLAKNPRLHAPLLAVGLGTILWAGYLFAARFSITSVSWLNYINPLVNLPIFVMGVVTGIVFNRVKPGAISFGAASLLQVVALVFVLMSNQLPFLMQPRFESDYKAGLFCCVLFFALSSMDGAVSRGLSIRPLIYLGEISYSIYLIHYGIIVGGAERKLVPLLSLPIWEQWVAELVIIGILSALSHAIIERPARHLIVNRWRAVRRPVAKVSVWVDPIP